ncbi:MAG TPA: hypothetical protein VLC46_13310 [Thermoanaerobaculia bacterium]|nr:hypothetical protein [Thermoanaerobaculia bacterium]
MHLVGVDIGFSQHRRTNGIAVFRGGSLVRAERLSVAERDEALKSLAHVDIVAIDAPLLPLGTSETFRRQCERTFSRGAFQKRCKPGMSHIRGTGQTLRQHGGRAAAQLIDANAVSTPEQALPHLLFGSNIVEAFPNAFLGVVVPDEDFVNAQRLKRGGKFDWLYNCWISRRLFEVIVDAAHLPDSIARRCRTETDHDIRAALVCLLTAGLFSTGNFAQSVMRLAATFSFHQPIFGRHGRVARSVDLYAGARLRISSRIQNSSVTSSAPKSPATPRGLKIRVRRLEISPTSSAEHLRP